MKDYKIIEVKRSIFEDNDKDAEKLRMELAAQGTYLLNLMSSPGAGKTTTLKRTIAMLKDEVKIGIMEADIDSDVDARAISPPQNPAILPPVPPGTVRSVHFAGYLSATSPFFCYHMHESPYKNPFSSHCYPRLYIHRNLIPVPH